MAKIEFREMFVVLARQDLSIAASTVGQLLMTQGRALIMFTGRYG
jgi:hypothetical protein